MYKFQKNIQLYSKYWLNKTIRFISRFKVVGLLDKEFELPSQVNVLKSASSINHTLLAFTMADCTSICFSSWSISPPYNDTVQYSVQDKTTFTMRSPFSSTRGENLNWFGLLFTKLEIISSLSPSGGILVICFKGKQKICFKGKQKRHLTIVVIMWKQVQLKVY